MDIKNQLKSNLGLIVLSISIILGCFILTEKKVTYQGGLPFESNESKIKLTGDIGGSKIPLEINTNSNDVTYNTELKIGDGEKLIILLSNGTQEKIEGQSIVAKYFHVSKLLMVEFLLKEKKSIRYYNTPIKWSNER